MKAVIITEHGSPGVLKLQERPVPVARLGDVTIKVLAAGVNRPDVQQRMGNYPPPPGVSPDIPGLEVAGIVTEVGPGCRRWKTGDKICALVAGGGYAEYCVVSEGQCLPIPENLSFAEAASLPETYFTVWSNVFDRAALKPGESLLVHGGSSGIGVAAIQLATLAGAKVYVTAGSTEKCSFCEQLGAVRAINYREEKFRDVIKVLTDKKGVNVVLDMIGGDYTADNLDVLAEDGRLVLISAMQGDQAAIRLWPLMRKRLTITGSTLRARETGFKAAIALNLEEKVWPWLRSGKIKPIVYQTFPLDQADQAHVLMESSQHIGKIVLTLD
jgi:NADPH:quinone reductase